MLILLFTYLFAMEDFLRFYPAGTYSGTDLYDSPCKIHIVDLSKDSTKPYFQVQITTESFPDYYFTYLYEAEYQDQVTTVLEGENHYLLELKNSNNALANIYFSFDQNFVEIERKGYASRGPRIRCTKKWGVYEISRSLTYQRSY